VKAQFTHKTKIERQGLRIAKLLQQSGFKAFWVGGSVRDLFLKQPLDNIDIATSAKPDETEKILTDAGYKTKPVGKGYGTILAITEAGPVEVTTFRREGRYVNRRRPKEVTYIDSFEEDSQRRDFTINAFYYDPVERNVFDVQDGLRDLKGKLLRFVGNPKQRIEEDALRMLRAARFSVQLGFKLEKKSFAAIKTRAKYIQDISGERIKSELDKILSLPNKVEGVRLVDQLGLLQFIMPEVTDLKKIWHKSKAYHLEGSVFEHTMLVLEKLRDGSPILSYAALYHDAGKATTAVPKRKEEGLVNSFPKHEFVSSDLAKKLAFRLKFGREDRDMLLWITKMHMIRIAFIWKMSDKKKIALAMHKYFPQLLEVWRADSIGNLRIVDGKTAPGTPKAYQEGTKLLKLIESKKNLVEKLVSGNMIMREAKINSGPKVGAMKNILAQKIILGKLKNISDVKNFLQKNTNQP
jgi:tRNA nucleotidyltransferase/poly(A) polymerase